MIKLPKRDDAIYKEIESFADYELTQCVAYEMAIRAPEIRKILEEKAYEDDNNEDSKNGILMPTDANKKIWNTFKEHGLEISVVLNKNYKNNTGILQSFFVKYTNNGLHKINANFAKDGINGITINGINHFIGSNSENAFAKIPECSLLIARPLLELKTTKRAMLDINFSLPIEEIKAQIEHIKKELDKDKKTIISPIDIFNDIVYASPNQIQKKPKAVKYADWFYIYDSYKMLKNGSKSDEIVFGEIDLKLMEHYRTDDDNYYSVETYKKTIMKNMKYLIDELGYQELITGVNSIG